MRRWSQELDNCLTAHSVNTFLTPLLCGANDGGTSSCTEAEGRHNEAGGFPGVGGFGAPHTKLEDSMATQPTATSSKVGISTDSTTLYMQQ